MTSGYIFSAVGAVLIVAGGSACGGANSPIDPTTTPFSNIGVAPDTAGASASPAPGNSASSGGNTSGGGSGRLVVNITDSPFSDAKAVIVTFTEVRVHRTGGSWETLPFAEGTSLTCDLKQLQDLAQDVLASAGNLPAGRYTQIRLVVDSASIHFDNAADAGPCAASIAPPAGRYGVVTVPSGEVRLNQNFTIGDGELTTILLDFDGDGSFKLSAKGNSGGNKSKTESNKPCNDNGRGNKPGCEQTDEDAEPTAEAELNQNIGSYTLHPVIKVLNVKDPDGDDL